VKGGPVRVLGRYALYGEIAAGGMATVHFGRLIGPVGFSRTVAIKRLHAQYAKDPDFVSMFLDEARLAARIQHPNVVSTLDVAADGDELFLVMEYVEGESLARLLRAVRASGRAVPPRVVGAIMTGALHGLHAAHEALNERGEPLAIVHRDISPQNVHVGTDGIARVLDFGIAKAAGRSQTTREGQIKGKLAYMPPEQITSGEIDRRVDIYAAGVVMWEALVGRRLFDGENEGALFHKIMHGEIPAPSALVEGIPSAVDAVVLCALAKSRDQRFPTAHAMAVAVEEALGVETQRVVGEFVHGVARESIARRAARISELEKEQTPTKKDSPAARASLSDAPTASSVLGGLHPNDPAPDGATAGARTVVRRPPRTVLVALAVMAGLGALAALGILATVGARRADPPRAAGAPASTSSTASDPTDRPPEGPAAASAPTALPPASAAPTTASATALPAARPARSTTAAPRTARAAPAADCAPPYVLVDGIRKLKPECI
jgi:serine/threonine-protein kinase